LSAPDKPAIIPAVMTVAKGPGMRMVCRVAPLFALAVVLSACGSSRPDRPPEDLRYRVWFSPNGEPLSGGPLGRLSCSDALAGWVLRADVNRDGVVDRAEFMADAETQFKRMDLDQDGFLTSDELSRYRFPYLTLSQERTPRAGAGGGNDSAELGRDGSGPPSGPPPNGAGPGGSATGDRNGPHGPVGAIGALPADTADPVMQADTNLDFRVSKTEFMAFAAETFAKLDKTGDGRLTKDEVIASCPATGKDGDGMGKSDGPPPQGGGGPSVPM
jgi:hypothetical protein